MSGFVLEEPAIKAQQPTRIKEQDTDSTQNRAMATIRYDDLPDDDGGDESGDDEIAPNLAPAQAAPLTVQRASDYVWGESARRSFQCAKKHFDFFLQGLSNDALASVMGADELAGRSYETIRKEKITHGLMDAYAGYLSNAKCFNNSSKYLSLNCAERYFSSVKNKLQRDLAIENKTNDSLNNSAGMGRIRTGMIKNITNRAIAEGVDVSKPHEVADADDVKSLAITCFWSMEQTLASMLFYFLSLVQLAGRAAEVAVIKFNDVTVYRPSEFPPNEKIASIRLWRSKTFNNRQDLSIFPHCDPLLEDWYFSMGYAMVMQDEGSPYLFPSFADKVQRTWEGGAATEESLEVTEQHCEAQNKAVTAYFKDLFVRIVEATQSFVSNHFGEEQQDDDDGDGNENAQGGGNAAETANSLESNRPFLSAFVQNYRINPRLSSHSSKKHAVNLANEVPAIKPTWLCYRAGWLIRAAHTIFDYLIPKAQNDRQVARAFSGWTSTDSRGNLGGGHPPMLSSLACHQQHGSEATRNAFVEALFHNFNSIHRDLKELLAASILHHLPSFVALLLEHPEDRFGSEELEAWQIHPFLQRLKQAGEIAGVTPVIMLEWSKIIEKDFNQRNFLYIPFNRIQDYEPFITDTRSLAGDLSAIAHVLSGLLRSNQEHRTHGIRVEGLIGQVLTAVRHESSRIDELIRLFQIQQRQSDAFQRQVLQILQHQHGNHGGSTFPMTLPDPAPTMDMDSNHRGSASTQIELNADGPLPGAVSQAPTTAVAPVAPTEAPNPFPLGLRKLTVGCLFKKWHIDGLHRIIHVSDTMKNIKSQVLFAVEYFSLFLEAHPDPLPQGVLYGSDPRARTWRVRFEGQVQGALVALKSFLNSEEVTGDRSQGQNSARRTRATSSITVFAFNKLMGEVSSEHWPLGPRTGVCNFQPPSRNLRTRAELVAHQAGVVERRSRRSANPN